MQDARERTERLASMLVNSLKRTLELVSDLSDEQMIGLQLRNTWRNFATPDRRDLFVGFRTCALEEEAGSNDDATDRARRWQQK